MEQVYETANYGDNAPENYQKFFVPSIGAPVARDLLEVANLKEAERVLDVACGTGIVTRLAAESVGSAGKVTGLDLNPGMIAVARSSTPAEFSIEWIEANVEEMPLEDASYDVVLCQMGLQFVADKIAALREMNRVLAPGGRVHISVPGPRPRLMEIMEEGIGHHLGPDWSKFVGIVFSMHDKEELHDLFQRSGFTDIHITARTRRLELPPPEEFLWQYIHSTPLVQAASKADKPVRDALERDVCSKWSEFVTGNNTCLDVPMTTVSAAR